MQFCHRVYESWREIQYEKYGAILGTLEELGIGIGKLVLDLGSASGFLYDYLEENGYCCEVVALDIDGDAILVNRSQHRVIGDANFPPFIDGAFDSLFCVDVAHLLRELDVSCVREGGLIVLALPVRHSKRFHDFVDLTKRYARPLRIFESNGREREKIAIFIKF